MLGNLVEGWTAWDGGANGTWKVHECMEWVTRFIEGLCRKEGRDEDIFVLVIRISIWNQMHIGSMPWNNESVIIH